MQTRGRKNQPFPLQPGWRDFCPRSSISSRINLPTRGAETPQGLPVPWVQEEYLGQCEILFHLSSC